jgi:hypothetical protein
MCLHKVSNERPGDNPETDGELHENKLLSQQDGKMSLRTGALRLLAVTQRMDEARLTSHTFSVACHMNQIGYETVAPPLLYVLA